jgi:transposase
VYNNEYVCGARVNKKRMIIKNDNQKKEYSKKEIRRWSDFGVWRRFGVSKK